jgi:hypothetical protein
MTDQQHSTAHEHDGRAQRPATQPNAHESHRSMRPSEERVRIVSVKFPPARTAAAVAHLLDVEERAATRGHHELQRLALIKAIQVATALRNEALDRAGAFNTRGGLMKNTNERYF